LDNEKRRAGGKKLSVSAHGGVTPLAAGLDMAFEVVKAAKIKDKDMLPVIVLVTDGRATYSERGPDAFGDALRSASRIGAEKIKSVVIDTDRNFIRLNLAEKLAAAMDADRYQLEDLRAQSVAQSPSL
jgi:magnesium chelatase subunit D